MAETTDWLLDRQDRHVLIEIANEVDVPYYRSDLLKPHRCHELIRLVQERSAGRLDTPAGRLLVSVSMAGGRIPPGNLVTVSDFLLLHGNGVDDPARVREMVASCRALPEYRGQPILFNEDDHYGFDRPDNNMGAAVSSRAGWGLFDYRRPREGFDEGYQNPPINWGLSSDRKRGFFRLLSEIAGERNPPEAEAAGWEERPPEAGPKRNTPIAPALPPAAD